MVLPRSLDDNTFATLSQIAFLNNVHIISHLTNDPVYLPNLRTKLSDPSLSAEELLDALRLLQEVCSLAKQLQVYNRAGFYRKFVEHRFFDPLERALTHPAPQLRLSCLDVLLATVQHDPSLLRQHILQQRPKCGMLYGLLHVVSSAGGSGEKPQVAEVLRGLLDPEGMEGREQDDFLNLFYESFVAQLAAPVAGKVHLGTGPMNGASIGDDAASQDVEGEEVDAGVLTSRQHVCELLCFCVHKHSYRIKYFILRNNVLVKILKLVSQRDKCLVLAALRFFRACIGLRDEFYNRYVVKNRCFESVMRQLIANRHRDNLLHSAILELFEFIRRENIKSLIAHLAETYQNELASLTHVEIFKGLLLRHEQNEEYKGVPQRPSAAPGLAPATTSAFQTGGRTFPDDDDDAAYFNESDEEEAPTGAVTATDDGAGGGERRPAAQSHPPPAQSPACEADAVAAMPGGGAGSQSLPVHAAAPPSSIRAFVSDLSEGVPWNNHDRAAPDDEDSRAKRPRIAPNGSGGGGGQL